MLMHNTGDYEQEHDGKEENNDNYIHFREFLFLHFFSKFIIIFELRFFSLCVRGVRRISFFFFQMAMLSLSPFSYTWFFFSFLFSIFSLAFFFLIMSPFSLLFTHVLFFFLLLCFFTLLCILSWSFLFFCLHVLSNVLKNMQSLKNHAIPIPPPTFLSKKYPPSSRSLLHS
jgi:hypothetical protein